VASPIATVASHKKWCMIQVVEKKYFCRLEHWAWETAECTYSSFGFFF